MTSEELEALKHDIDELKRAVKKADPFLRSVVALRSLATLSIPLGALILAFCLISHFLVQSYASLGSVPSAWKQAFWMTLGVVVIGGGALKWLLLAKRAAQIEKGATVFTAIKAMYGGGWLNVNLPITICIFAIGAFLVRIGHPWYIAAETSIFLGLICNSFAIAFDRREYLVTGWYAVISALVALFFIESAPFIWLAVVWAGIFFVYAASGIYYLPRVEKGA
jgi:hypothetical protein